MKVYRLTRNKYSTPRSERSAAIRGARWNSAGTDILYTSSSRALAMAEVFVPLNLDLLPHDFVMVQSNVPDQLTIQRIDGNQLPLRWNAFPSLDYFQKSGDLFILNQKNPTLQVPSASVPGDFDYLINPVHPHFNKVTIDCNRFSF